MKRIITLSTVVTVLMVSVAIAASDKPKEDQGNSVEKAEQKAAEEAGRQLGKVAKDGKGKDIDAGLSWRVALLPYLGYENLHEQFHHDEPWNSPHNKRLIKMMPPIYRSSPRLPDGRTTFVALVSPKSVITRETGGIRLSDVPDGASNTILCVAASPEEAVIWTKPEDIRFDPEHPLRGLGRRGFFLALFVDGSVHRLTSSIDKQTMRRLVYRNDGKPVMLPR